MPVLEDVDAALKEIWAPLVEGTIPDNYEGLIVTRVDSQGKPFLCVSGCPVGPPGEPRPVQYDRKRKRKRKHSHGRR